MDIYVGNLSYDTTEATLREAFAAHGTVHMARIVTDRDTGRSRGFGFVEMADPQEAAAAIGALNGAELDGMVLTVNEARPREERPSRDFHPGGGSSRYGNDRGGPRRSGGFGDRGRSRDGGNFGFRSRDFGPRGRG